MKRTIPILASLFVFSALVISVLPPLSKTQEPDFPDHIHQQQLQREGN